MYPKKELAQILISACHQFKIETVVISPGSRNAPLTIGFSNHSEIETFSIVDERCAAFYALGIAQQTQKPVAILCTSGSALLNYYPAIAEAFYSNIPLVVLSADRPKHLIDIGDGQTIRQENVFENHILFSANLIENPKFKTRNSQLIGEALQIATSNKGPVHINIPFDEPLYETVSVLEDFHFPRISMSSLDNSHVDYSFFADIWNSAKKKIILVGVNFPDKKINELIHFYAEDSSVLILTETTSNLHHTNVVDSIDQLIFSLNESEFKELQPEVLITFGGMMISKKIKQLSDAINSWAINPTGSEGYRTAEVTLGGVNTNELSSKTMMVKKHSGLFFIGEVVDVTGHLGGYNFQWAWSSGFVAGQYA